MDYINFQQQNQMNGLMGQHGKENYYERVRPAHDRSGRKIHQEQVSSNSALRMKIEGNLTPVRGPSPVERRELADVENEVSFQQARGREGKESAKRGSARQRDFEMKVNSISTINGRIEELLSFVKKDRKEERAKRDHTRQKQQSKKEVGVLRESEINRWEAPREVGTSPKKERRERPSYLDRSSLSPAPSWNHDYHQTRPVEPKISQFFQQPVEEPISRHQLARQDIYQTRQRTYSPSPIQIQRQSTTDSYNLRNLRSKYMAEQRASKDKSASKRPAKQYLRDQTPVDKAPVKEKKQWKYNLDLSPQPVQRQQQGRTHYNNYINRSMDRTSEGVEALLSERKRRRAQQTVVERSIIEESSMVSEVRGSPESYKPRQSIESVYEAQVLQARRQVSPVRRDEPELLPPRRQPSPVRRQPSRHRHSDSWHSPMEAIPQTRTISNYPAVKMDESCQQRNHKITATTKLIDQQINRIKSKIQVSEKNTEVMQHKIGGGTSVGESRVGEKSGAREEATRIARQLSRQVEIDSKLRAAREEFQKVAGDEKWDQLQMALNRQGISYTRGQLESFVKLAADEHNPFGSTVSGITPAQVADLLVEAESHWSDKVCSCARATALSHQGFEVAQLDLGRKGHLSTQDMVCFINLYSGSFYRNRDVSLVMRRLQSSPNHIDYSAFIRTMTQ